ncbi:MAG TPA: hypothetical protein VGB55_08125 [Tepidisphaeraceae bacterium]
MTAFAQSDLIRPGLLAIRLYWKPFLLIDACALLFVIGYFQIASVHSAAGRFADWKDAGGLPAVMLMGAISGAILPELAKIVALGQWKFDRKRWSDVAFHMGLFAFVAIMASTFYGFVAQFIRSDGAAGVAMKVLVDQLIYSPFIALPLMVFAYTWRECRWSFPRAAARLGGAWYLRRVAPLIIPTWVFWFPMTSLMYSLSDDFVFCFAMIAQAAWCLLMTFVAGQPQPDELGDEADIALGTAA